MRYTYLKNTITLFNVYCVPTYEYVHNLHQQNLYNLGSVERLYFENVFESFFRRYVLWNYHINSAVNCPHAEPDSLPSSGLPSCRAWWGQAIPLKGNDWTNHSEHAFLSSFFPKFFIFIPITGGRTLFADFIEILGYTAFDMGMSIS